VHPNQLKGKIVAETQARRHHMSALILEGAVLTASITSEAVADLGLKVGDDAWAIIKASDGLVAKWSVTCVSLWRSPDPAGCDNT
jgi:molybdopterin-binding protein